MISFTAKVPNLHGMLERLLPNEQDMRDVAMDAASVIRERTASGIGSDGAGFVPYSDAYYERKQESGRNPDPVSLMWDNTMLGSMAVRKIENGAELYFASDEQQIKARRHHYGLDRMPRRPFFALMQPEFQRLTSELWQRLRGRRL